MIKVAIIEDIEEIRESLRVLINGSADFECVRTYSNAEDAILDLPKQNIDVVLMDIHLPGMNGINALTELVPVMPKTQFMMCTNYEDDDYVFSALKNGANGYILKRSSPTHIMEAISDLNQGGSPMNSEIARRVVAYFQKKNKPSVASESLTERELQIVNFLSKGFLYKEIAAKLFISNNTVKKHIHNIYEKLQVQNRLEAVNKVFGSHL